MKKKLMACATIAALLCTFSSCGEEGGNKSTPAAKTADSKGAQVFAQYCVSCHGKDGTLGLSGAANLMVSILTKKEAKEVVTNGRRLMSPFKDVLTPEEIDAVVDYVVTLRR